MRTFTVVLSVICAVGLGKGLFLFLRPEFGIELQKKFYSRINWRIEPIDLRKEIRNTRIMGLLLIAIAVLTMVLAAAGIF